MERVNITAANHARYMKCTANMDDVRKSGTHVFDVETFETVQPILDRDGGHLMLYATFCPACVLLMSPRDQKIAVRGDKKLQAWVRQLRARQEAA